MCIIYGGLGLRGRAGRPLAHSWTDVREWKSARRGAARSCRLAWLLSRVLWDIEHRGLEERPRVNASLHSGFLGSRVKGDRSLDSPYRAQLTYHSFVQAPLAQSPRAHPTCPQDNVHTTTCAQGNVSIGLLLLHLFTVLSHTTCSVCNSRQGCALGYSGERLTNAWFPMR